VTVCPKCGYREPVNWRGSRFDFNAFYIRFDEAQQEPTLKEICKQLVDKPNFWPWKEKYHTYYRRGTGGIYLYRVLHEDFKVPRERKRHK